MEFYVLLIIIAVVVLVCMLTYIGMNMTSKTSAIPFPPDALECPDYWVSDGNGNCVADAKNLGTYTSGSSIRPDKIQKTGATLLCAKKDWANTNNVVWTGIDNYNLC